MNFHDLGLAKDLLRAIDSQGYLTATPIQLKAIPPILAGRDLMGCAQTGTGKTAAFSLPTLQRLRASREGAEPRGRRPIRSLVLTPTRELAAQIGESLTAYGRFTGMRNTVIFGGVGQGPQASALRRGVDILVATPGRLEDLMQQGIVSLDRVEILILDEADHMLDIGFIHALKRIVKKVPKKRQTLMFSATMPREIRELASNWLIDPVHVQVAPVSTPAEDVEQSIYYVEKKQKPHLFASLLREFRGTRTLAFTRTKYGADKVVRHLKRAGFSASAIHGNKSQGQRQRALDQFKAGHIAILVATDIAARGLDIDNVTHVFNLDLPEVAEVYVHRIGRTGRAGASGKAISFCTQDERAYLRAIERLTRRSVPVRSTPQEFLSADSPAPVAVAAESTAPRKTASKPRARPQGERGGPRGGQDGRRGRGGRGAAGGESRDSSKASSSGRPRRRRSKRRGGKQSGQQRSA